MQLTSITQQKRNVENVNLFLDNKFWVSLSKNQLLDFGLYKGIDVDEDLKEKIESASGENKILEKTYKFLFLRPRSEFEVKTYLKLRRGLDEDYAKSILEKLRTKGFIDDEKFAEWYVKNRLESGKYGENRIKAELIKKGVSRDLIYQVLDKFKDNETYKEAQNEKIQSYIEKMKRTLKAKDERELKNKMIQRLMAKGFRYEDVKNLV